MDDYDNIVAIFIEEAEDIIENIELKLPDLENEEEQASTINEIFRGVHTLKGNANSFGFETLGSFVHTFENMLEILRNDPSLLSEEVMTVLYEGMDVVKETFENEKQGIKEVSTQYDVLLKKIDDILEELKEENSVLEEKPNALLDSLSFLNDDVEEEVFQSQEEIDSSKLEMKNEKKYNLDELRNVRNLFLEEIKNSDESEKLYNVRMNFDHDFYIRGYEPSIFISLFEEKGRILKTFGYLSKSIPELEFYDFDKYYFEEFNLYVLSSETREELVEVFDFIAEENEYDLIEISKNYVIDKVKEEKEEIEEIEENKEELKQETKETNSEVEVSKKENISSQDSTLRISGKKVDDLFNSVGELVIAQSFLEHNPNIVGLNDHDIKNQLSMIQKITKSVQTRVMELRMVPIKNTFMKLKRTVRDVSLKINKDIDLIIKGEDSELDKSMVDSLGEPLIHLIRNAIDHGIESKEERLENNKPQRGTVFLSAFHRGSNFIIEIKDDGKGIDTESVLNKAISNNLADSSKSYTDKEIYAMLFKPGFSTVEEITDISGRGVGLDSVNSSVADNKGKIVVSSELGVGTTFQIVLPLTLAIIDGMVVKIDSETYIIPILSIIETFKLKGGAVKSFSEDNKFINHRGVMLPILNIHQAMGKDVEEEYKEKEIKLFVCIEHSRGNFIIPVDKIMGKQQVVIKSLNKTIFDSKEVSGATILGDGGLSLILNIDGLSEKIYQVEES